MNRKGKFIAVANMKGGVGKTTTVVSLAESLAAEDASKKVLVIDLDPQASASMCIAGDDLLAELIDDGRTLEAFLDTRLIHGGTADLDTLVRKQISAVWHANAQLDLSLLPCGPDLRMVERELLYELTSRDFSMNAIDGKIWRLFTKDFAGLKKSYDYILFDCAPGISPVTEAAIRMADLVIVPTIPDHLSVYGLNAFHGSIWAQKGGSMPAPRSPPVILISRLLQVRQHAIVTACLIQGAQAPGSAYRIFETAVPQAAGLADALTKEGDFTFTQKYTAPIIHQTLMPLVQEVKGML